MAEEIELDGAANKPINQTSPIDHAGSVNIGPSASAMDVINSYLNTPEEQLIPWEDCSLPSRGYYYGWLDGTVKVRAMTQTAEKILATQRLAQSGQSVDYLFKECVRLPGDMPPEDLLLGDRLFLLFYIRGITHGNMYEFAVTCPNEECKATSTHVYDLNELATTIKSADPTIGREPFRVHLPYMSRVTGKDCYVGVRLLRGYDTNQLLAQRRAKRKMYGPQGPRARSLNATMQKRETEAIDNTITENLERVIVNVLGVDDPFVIRQFVEKLHATDSGAIREFLRDHTPGIDTTIVINCPSCGNEYNVELPITESFFRPSKQ